MEIRELEYEGQRTAEMRRKQRRDKGTGDEINIVTLNTRNGRQRNIHKENKGGRMRDMRRKGN